MHEAVCFLCCFIAINMKIITLRHRYFLGVFIWKRAGLFIIQQTMFRIRICGCIMNKETCLLDNKGTVSCTIQETKPRRSPLWTSFLRNENTHLTLKEKIKRPTLFVILY